MQIIMSAPRVVKGSHYSNPEWINKTFCRECDTHLEYKFEHLHRVGACTECLSGCTTSLNKTIYINCVNCGNKIYVDCEIPNVVSKKVNSSCCNIL